MAKIIGNTTATPNPRPDWNQTDETKADYIKNKPAIPSDIADLNATITELNYMGGVTDSVQDQLDAKTQVQVINEDITEVLSTLKIHKLSQEEYDQSLADGSLEDNVIYLTPDEVYYTETEMDALLLSKSDISHNHDDRYDAKGSSDEVFNSAMSYIDTAVNEAKSHSNTNLSMAKSYTDNAVAQKTQIQIITWEDDD